MKHNKPTYNFFKNTSYALAGLTNVFKTEKSFKIELVFFIVLQFVAWFSSVNWDLKLILSAILFIPLIVEIINSALERVVDLVTKEHHELAKQAKDAGSAAVFLSILLVVVVWIAIWFNVLVNT